ncbi:hypothetical protein [Brevibacillus antibioticus]|uniref:hypothetical protein n=1 Tax=Brevibacillus antibioticus TaxID=2570228 RepID=UPI00138FB18F|nr:hypothetical protein [Brevibacillus antibioticus]
MQRGKRRLENMWQGFDSTTTVTIEDSEFTNRQAIAQTVFQHSKEQKHHFPNDTFAM